MPDFLTPDVMRMLERVFVIGGGILAVYFAYRLFQIATIPEKASPRFKSALVEFGICRLVPAVFFAVLGAYVLYASIERSMASPSAASPPILTAAEWDRLGAALDRLPRAERDDAKRLLATARARSSRGGGTTGTAERRAGAL